MPAALTPEICTERGVPAIHPGELLQECLAGSGLSVADAARRLGVSRQTVHAVLAHARAVTPEMALRLARLFGSDAATWPNLQRRWDLETRERTMGAVLATIHRWDEMT